MMYLLALLINAFSISGHISKFEVMYFDILLIDIASIPDYTVTHVLLINLSHSGHNKHYSYVLLISAFFISGYSKF